MSESTIEGIDEIIAKFKQLEEVPQSIVTKAGPKRSKHGVKFCPGQPPTGG